MTERILQHLKIRKADPARLYLQELIAAYCRTVPWESVSRIVKKARTTNPENCFRGEEEFWLSAFENGTGGTCYESNWAFFHLLKALGYEGYLTINAVRDKSSNHAAIVVLIDGCKYIADVGYPMYSLVGFAENRTVCTNTESYTYAAKPISPVEYVIEDTLHPKPYLFHLTDVPVSSQQYLKIATDDYGDAGLFLDRIIVRKVIDNVPVRFDSEDLPYNIHTIQAGNRQRNYIAQQDCIVSLNRHFNINSTLIKQAFDTLNLPYS